MQTQEMAVMTTNRRHLGLVAVAVLTALIGSWAATKADASSDTTALPTTVERLDPAINALVPEHASLERIATGFKWTEGLLWLPTNQLIFAEIPSNSIRIFTPGAGVSIFMQPSGYKGAKSYGGPEPGSNAMTLDADGRLTVAGHAQRDVWRLERMSAKAQVTILADRYDGKRLNSPNDLVYKSDGSLYFTDPPYGLRTQSDTDPEKQLQFSGVYRIPRASSQKPGAAPAREALELLVKDLPRPNGIAFSPDEKYLYVDNSEPRMFWMRYTVKADGTLTSPKLLCEAGIYSHHGAPDGLKVDKQGNIYSAGPGGVWILSPAGKHLGTIDTPGPVGNVAWGGVDHKTLYIASGPDLYRIVLKVQGVYPHTR
jgi:gluconolactonase